MAANAATITLAQMDELLAPHSFTTINLAGVREVVFSKAYTHILIDDVRIPLSLRIYTSIVDGESRGVGDDAIRINVCTRKKNGTALIIGADKRVNRVERWRTNLTARLANWQQELLVGLCPRSCPKCQSLMLLRTSGRRQHYAPFYGCIEYPDCRGTRVA